MSPYQRIINALNEWRKACGLSLLASELDADDAAEVTEKLVADWQRLDKAHQSARRDANAYSKKLADLSVKLAAARIDADAYSKHLDEIDISLDNHGVKAISPDESIAETIERVLSDYAKERQRREAAEGNAVAWQEEGDAANAELAAELAKERQRRKAAEDDAAAWQAQHRGIASQLQYQERRANALQEKLTALNDELNGVVAARNELHDENSALRSELAEARADRSRARARVESYTATLLDINDVLVQAKVGAPGEDPNIVDIVKALVAERDTARYDAACWEADAIKTRQELQWAQADAAKWQAKYEDMAGTLHRMVKLYLTKEVCQ